MRGGGRFSKATHASLEVLVSSVGFVVALAGTQALTLGRVFQLGPIMNEGGTCFIFKDVHRGNNLCNVKNSPTAERKGSFV